MRRWKRLFYYLTINALVSACTVLVVLALWSRLYPSASGNLFGDSDLQILNLPKEAASNATDTGVQAPGENPLEAPGTALATGVPTATQPPEQPGEPLTLTYQVKAGDTLGAIAAEFEISVEELIAANDLADPNRLDVGQTLVIPRVEEQPSEPEAVPTTTPAPDRATATARPSSPTPPQAPGAAQVVIDSVIGTGDLASERVFLKRSGAGELSLAGWQLLDASGQIFIFPKFKLFEGGAVYLYSRVGQPTSVELYWGLDAPVWQSGEAIVLLDDQGVVRATFSVP